MYFLDVDNTRARLSDLGFEIDALKRSMSSYPSLPMAARKHLREDFVTGYIAAKEAVSHLGDFTSCILYIGSMGNRLPLENSHLYERLRHSYNEYRPNYLAPGHVFLRHDQYALVSFCELVVNYRFAAVLVQHASRSWVSFAEDECVYLVEGA